MCVISRFSMGLKIRLETVQCSARSGHVVTLIAGNMLFGVLFTCFSYG